MLYLIETHGPITTNTYLYGDDETRHAFLIDPGFTPEHILAAIREKGITVERILLTHGHFDHIGGVTGLLAQWPDLPVHIAPGDEPWAFTRANAWGGEYPATARPATLVADLVDGAELSAAGLSARILATPGHTPGGVCLLFNDVPLLLSGDTLFAGSCGRTDFPGGSRTALAASLRRLAALPPETVVVPGHGTTTTIAREVASNPFLHMDF